MTKILHIINGEFYAGAERVQDLLAKRLPEHGYEVGFACLKEGPFASARQSTGPVYLTPMNSRFDFAIGQRLADLARREGYVAFHSHTVRSLMAGRLAAQRSGLPLLHHVHSPVRRDTESFLRNLINSRTENFCARRARKLIAVSRALRDELQTIGFADEKIRLVPNGVPVMKATNDWQAPSGVWTIGMAALFRPRKGTEILLQALARLKAKGLPVRLRLVGGFETPDYEREVKALAASLGVDAMMDWTGFTRDIASELKRMNIFVVPSLFGEGLPMVLLEAMAAGLPIVGSKIDGIADVLADGAGVIVPPNDADSLADALASMIGQGTDLQTMADTGFARQRNQYSDIAMAAGVAQVYRECGL